MKKLGAKIVLVLATATCRQHQLNIGFRPNLFEEASTVRGLERGPGDLDIEACHWKGQ